MTIFLDWVLESSISINVRNLCFPRFASSFLKYKKKYKKVFKLGVREFQFPKYKNFFRAHKFAS